MSYGLTVYPTPLFNTPLFPEIFLGDRLRLAPDGRMTELETVLFPWSSVEILKKVSPRILEVRSEAYLPHKSFYVDSRFLEEGTTPFPSPLATLPSASTVIEALLQMEHTPYFWGSNWHQGIPQLIHFFPPPHALEPIEARRWTMTGVDCSGLLYEATKGFSPRNTSQLVDWGRGVSIEGKEFEQIIEKILPLDLLVWKGHVIIAIDQKEGIEANLALCEVRRDRWESIYQRMLQNKTPVNDYNASTATEKYVVRRWHPEIVED